MRIVDTSRFKCKGTLSLCLHLAMLITLLGACAPWSVPLTEEAPGQVTGGELQPTPESGKVDIETSTLESPIELPTRRVSGCPGLESSLFQITQAPDPIDLANQLQFQVQGNKIQVHLVLDNEDTNCLQEFGVDIGTQSGKQVQAYVPIDRLCELANIEEVLAIRMPAQAVPQ